MGTVTRADRRTDHRADGQVRRSGCPSRRSGSSRRRRRRRRTSSPRRAKSADRMLGVMRVAFRHGVRGAGGHNVPLLQFGARSREKPLAAASVRGCPTARRQRVLERPGVAPGAARVHHPHTGRTVKPTTSASLSLRASFPNSPIRASTSSCRPYRSHHQHRRTPGPGDQPPLDHHRRQPARAGSARAGRGRAAAPLAPGETFEYTSGRRCPPRWAMMRGTYHCVGENGIPFEVPISNSSWRCRVPLLTPRGDCFLAHEAHSLSVRAVGAACRVHHHLRNPLNRALAQAYRPRGRRPARAVAFGAGGHAARSLAGKLKPASWAEMPGWSNDDLSQFWPLFILQLPRADAAHQRNNLAAPARRRRAPGSRSARRPIRRARRRRATARRAPLPANLSATLAAERRRRQAGHEHRHRLLRAAGARFAAAGRRLSMAAVHRAGGPADHRPGVGVSGTGRQRVRAASSTASASCPRHPRRHRGSGRRPPVLVGGRSGGQLSAGAGFAACC